MVQTLQSRSGVLALLAGGELDRRTGSLVGPVAQRMLEGFSLSCCFLFRERARPRAGPVEPTVEEVEMKQAMARASQYVVLAVDSTKLGQRSAVRALNLDQIQTVVTELDPADVRLDPYRDRVLLLDRQADAAALDRGVASVDHDRLAGQVTGGRRAEQGDQALEIRRLTHPPPRISPRHCSASAGFAAVNSRVMSERM